MGVGVQYKNEEVNFPLLHLTCDRLIFESMAVSLFGDEIDVGLQAYSILTTGNDYLGNRLPVLFHSFSEYRLPMHLYLSVPFIKLFGLNEVGVRTTSVLMGYLSLIFFYLLIRKIYGLGEILLCVLNDIYWSKDLFMLMWLNYNDFFCT